MSLSELWAFISENADALSVLLALATFIGGVIGFLIKTIWGRFSKSSEQKREKIADLENIIANLKHEVCLLQEELSQYHSVEKGMDGVSYILKLQPKFALFVGIAIKKLFLFMIMVMENTYALSVIMKVSIILVKTKQSKHINLNFGILSITLIMMYTTTIISNLFLIFNLYVLRQHSCLFELARDEGQNLLGKGNHHAARKGEEAVCSLGRVV